MKKTLKIIIPTLLLAMITFMGYRVIAIINHKKEVVEHIKAIPSFSYATISGKLFSNKDLKENTPIIFLYFNSECEHCQSEAKQITDNIKQLAEIQLIFISFEEPKKIIAFAKKYKIDHYDNITFLCDTQVSFSTTFDVKSLPTLVVYDKNKRLIEKVKGEIKIAMILKKIKSNNK